MSDLDAVRALLAEAPQMVEALRVQAPWLEVEGQHFVGGAFRKCADTIEALADALGGLVDAVEAAGKIHGRAGDSGPLSSDYCGECEIEWPCPTLRALGVSGTEPQ